MFGYAVGQPQFLPLFLLLKRCHKAQKGAGTGWLGLSLVKALQGELIKWHYPASGTVAVARPTRLTPSGFALGEAIVEEECGK